MKEPSIGNNCGFSTLEITLAFAIMSLALSGVVFALFGTNYWTIAAQRHTTAITEAEAKLEAWHHLTQTDFLSASSSEISDLSPCIKEVAVKISWQVTPYPTSTVTLFSLLTNPSEAKALGGDCLFNEPRADWSNPILASSTTFSSRPLAIDILNETTYLATDQSPYFKIITASGEQTFANYFQVGDLINDLDVVYNPDTQKTYAYAAIASSTNQFQIIEVTDPQNPVLIASRSLYGVDPTGTAPEGWRLTYYDHFIYLTTRFTAGPEFHIFDVTDNTNPFEISVGRNLNTSVYDLAVRDQTINATTYRLAYMATTQDSQELQILDVTDPTTIQTLPSLNLPDSSACVSNEPDTKTIFIAGYTAYVGRENLTNCATLPDLYLIDISNPIATTSIKASANLGTSVIGLKVSGQNIFVATTNITNPPASKLLDLNGNYLYLAKDKARLVEIWQQNQTVLTKIGTYTASLEPLQLITSP